MPRAARLLPVLLGAAVLAGGCGDPKPEPAENMTIGLRLDEYRIMPQAVSAPAGHLRLIMRNLGTLPHNVVVTTIPEVGSDDPAVEIARTETVHAGERTEVSFTLKPGTYRLYCAIGNHDDLGQAGTLVVK
ncbi:MAG: cupredoxin domain-containing protein [Solirubrobacteraceae bacterium]